MLPSDNQLPKSRFKLVVISAAVLIVVLSVGLGVRWFAGQTTKTIQPAVGAGKPIILNEYSGGNVAVHFQEFPVTIFMLGKPEPVAVETFGYAPRVKVQCDSMSGYQAMERGTMTSILGLWLTPIGLARVADKSGFESFAKEVADDSAPGGSPITIEDTEAPATGILSHIKDGRGVKVSVGMSFVKFDKGVLVMSFVAADDKSAIWMATRMAQSAQFKKLPADWAARKARSAPQK